MSRNPLLHLACGLTAVACLASTAGAKPAETKKEPAEAAEQALTKDQIPAAVLTAFQKSYPTAVIKGASQETEDSVLYVEIESVDGTVKRDVKYTSAGKVVEIEEAMDAGALPEAVHLQIAKDFAGGHIEKAEKVTQGTVTEFELRIKTAANTMVLVMDSTGKTLRSHVVKSDDDEEDEADEAGEGQ